MLEKPYYPEVGIPQCMPFQLIKEGMRIHPGFLGQDCPYDEDLKEIFRTLFTSEATVDAEVLDWLGEDTDRWDKLEKECVSMYSRLQTYGEHIHADDTSEKMAYFRTSTTLLEKIVGLQERALGLKRLNEFQQTVLDVIEQVLTPDQRTGVMDRLRGAIGS